VGYAWEESGPSLAARWARTLEQHVEKISSLPFVDVLYIRATGATVKQPGRLDLDPVRLTLDAAKAKGLRVAFRIQLSNYSFQPEKVALPEFLLTVAGEDRAHAAWRGEFREPRYDHPDSKRHLPT
jgi:hypothetical protein